MKDFDNLPPLHQWFITKNLFTRKKDEYTHLLLNGGMLRIEDNEEFLRLYAKDLRLGFKHYICEIKTPIFKLFSDLDFFEEAELSNEYLLQVLTEIQNVVCEFFKVKSNLIVCTTDSKKVNVHGAEYTKTGVHLIWDNLYVTKLTALHLRKAIIQKLQVKFDERPAYNTWSEVVDLTVYDANGLRMIGSRKMTECGVCKRSKTKLCSNPACVAMFSGARKVDEGRAYRPTIVLNADCNENTELLKSLQSDTLEMVKTTSIRISGADESPFEFPTWYEVCVDPGKRPRKLKTKQFQPPSKEDQDGLNQLKPKKGIPSSDSRFIQLQSFIKKEMPSVFQTTHLLDLHECANGAYYVARTNSHFCMNVNREHSSNTIYFYIDMLCVYQKCFCRCETSEGRQFGYCRDYRSAGRPLSEKLKLLLFPRQMEEKNKNKVTSHQQFRNLSTTDHLEDLLERYNERLLMKNKYERKFNKPKVRE